MRKKAKTNEKGFTLIELLIVIAIIGILASVILVSLNFARGDANAAKALVSLESAAKLAEICKVRGGDINSPVTNPVTGNPGNRICNLASITENWPNLTGAGFVYLNSLTGGAGTSDFGFSARLSTGNAKQIVCGANRNLDGWLGGAAGHPDVNYDFRNISASCRKSGF